MISRHTRLWKSRALFLGLSLLGAVAVAAQFSRASAAQAAGPKVIVLGFDGADPRMVERYISEGHLPNLKKLSEQGAFTPLGTTRPPESPVSWSAFATGMNPGKTRIFDFLVRIPGTYLPDIALAKEGSEPLLPETSLRVAIAATFGAAGFAVVFLVLGLLLKVRRPVSLVAAGALGVAIFGASLYAILSYLPRELPKAIGTREGVSFWKYTTQNGVRTVALEAPVTFPAEELPGGKLLTGLGTPDMLRTWGFWSLYTTDLFEEEPSETGGSLIPLDFVDGVAQSTIRGPRNFTVKEDKKPEIVLPITFNHDPEQGTLTIATQGESISLGPGEWSDWVQLTFDLNPLISLHGMTRFCLLSLSPNVQVYMEPINWNPKRLPPTVHISYPRDYAGELADAIGMYETIGWSTATNPLKDEAIGYDAFMKDVEFVTDKQRQMLFHELDQDDWQCLVGVFLFTDRVQHMLWRFEDEGHPVYDAEMARKYGQGIREAYQEMDRIVGEVMEKYVDEDTHLFVVSDHGFHSFRYGVNLNTWLVKSGYMHIKGQAGPVKLENLFDPDARFFPNVDWSRTQAYALGLSGIYLNVAGREPEGIVAPGAEYEEVRRRIIADLLELEDAATGERPVVSAVSRDEAFHGPFVEEAYDIVVGFAPGYRTSWQTTLGGIPPDIIELNRNNWSGDHCSSDPDLTAGIFLSNRPIEKAAPSIIDMAPTILKIFDIPVPGDMDGEPLL